MEIYLRPDSLGSRFEIEIWVQNFYWGAPLEQTTGGEWRKQDWVQGAAELWCPHKGLSQSHRELRWSCRVVWNWGKNTELSHLVLNTLRIQAASKREGITPWQLNSLEGNFKRERISWEAVLANTPSSCGRVPPVLREIRVTHNSNDEKIFTRSCGHSQLVASESQLHNLFS